MSKYRKAFELEGVIQNQTDSWQDSLTNPIKVGNPIPFKLATFYMSEARAIEHQAKYGGEVRPCWRSHYDEETGAVLDSYVCRWTDYRRAFKAEHELTEEEFTSDHWQTLFVLTYPEARQS